MMLLGSSFACEMGAFVAMIAAIVERNGARAAGHVTRTKLTQLEAYNTGMPLNLSVD